MKKVIVLGAGYGALAVVKALGQQDIPVVLLYTAWDDHAYHSRFVSERVKIPNPMDDSNGLLHLLMETQEDWDGALLIPTLDEYIIFVSQNRDKLKERYVFTTQSWDIVDRIINKDRLYPQAQKNDVPTPRFFLPDSIEFLNEHKEEFSYPCILKPNETHKFDRLYGKKNFVVHDFQNLMELFTDTQKNGLEMMISEIIPGDDSTIYSYRSYIDSQGEILGEMCTQKLRQYPSGFGQAAVLKTTTLMPEVREQALRLLRSLSFHGQSIVEFRWDHRDNQYKLMEINSRPGVTEWLEVKAGMNFPYMTYLDLVENIRTPSPTYRKELYWIHNYWEVINFFSSLRRGNLNLYEFLKPYWQEKVFVVPFSDDPVLFLFETYSNFKRALRKNRKSFASESEVNSKLQSGFHLNH